MVNTIEDHLEIIPLNGIDSSAPPLLPKKSYNISPPPAVPKRQHTKNSISCLKFWKQRFFDYCSNTSIHGIQYLGERRPTLDRFIWLALILISFFFCIDSITEIYEKWNDTPVIVSFSEKSTDIWSIPFPAITICAESKRWHREGMTYDERLDDFINERKSFTTNLTNEIEEFLTMLHICLNDAEDFANNPPLSYPPVDYIEVLEKMLPPFGDNFVQCKLLGNDTDNCIQYFRKTYTEEGLCFTFNGLNSQDLYREDTVQYQDMQQMEMNTNNFSGGFLGRKLTWSLEEGYTAGTELGTSYPARVLSSGTKAGVTAILLDNKTNIDYGCREASQGYKLLLHSPDDVPQVSKHFLHIPMNEETTIAVLPSMMTTSKAIAKYSPEKRQCYMAKERQLRFFQVYTENNCELECLTNFTLHRCGCVKFSMPRNRDMPLCREHQIHCYENAEDDLMLEQFSDNLDNCHCLPACTSLDYNVEISQSYFDVERTLNAMSGGQEQEEEQKMPEQQQISNYEYASFSIYFKDNHFITIKRSELYGLYDFIANCGGILGLFMGVSILSVIEIFYHLTLRLWANLKRKISIKIIT
ncbi:pickpocket protein 28-like [Musca vetustissima]|uniref:pickpocket protein 28-like n=1 Tax=Musca vetustissima TaxID=27455 RepID=UPI002AB5FB98|nr:pickpocket protein 28-like [Musca vetustissima]